MTQRSPDQLSSALITTMLVNGSKQKMKLELLRPLLGRSTVSIRFLDCHRFELSSEGGNAPVRLELETTESENTEVGCQLFRRAQEVLGGARLQRTTCEVCFPDSISPLTAYIGFCIRLLDVVGIKNASNIAWDQSPNCIYVETHRRNLDIGKHGTRSLFFLPTRKQANERIESIANKLGLFDRDDEASMVALTNLYLGVISGADSPLLTELLEKCHD